MSHVAAPVAARQVAAVAEIRGDEIHGLVQLMRMSMLDVRRHPWVVGTGHEDPYMMKNKGGRAKTETAEHGRPRDHNLNQNHGNHHNRNQEHGILRSQDLNRERGILKYRNLSQGHGILRFQNLNQEHGTLKHQDLNREARNPNQSNPGRDNLDQKEVKKEALIQMLNRESSPGHGLQ
jgi:hypothetical protein